MDVQNCCIRVLVWQLRRAESYLSLGGVSMGIGGSIVDLLLENTLVCGLVAVW
jgi:hypothetical protein